MSKRIVKSKSLKEVEANTKYMKCTFYLDCVDGEDFNGMHVIHIKITPTKTHAKKH